MKTVIKGVETLAEYKQVREDLEEKASRAYKADSSHGLPVESRREQNGKIKITFEDGTEKEMER